MNLIKYTNKAINVGMAIYVDSLNGDVVNDVIPSIARFISFV